MLKTDRSKHDICLAAIKRHTIAPYDFTWTRFYECNDDFGQVYTGMPIAWLESELIICSTIIDSANYSLLTTRRLITRAGHTEQQADIDHLTDLWYGDFKGYSKQLFTFGTVNTNDGNTIKYIIETGRASMIMIYGLKTILRTREMTGFQTDNVTAVWNRKQGS